MLSNNTKLLFSALVVVAVNAGCVKKRPTIEAQGANLSELVAVEQANNLRCTLTTKPTSIEKINEKSIEVPYKNTPYSEAERVDVGDSGFVFYNIVDFDTNCPYLADNKEMLEFRGKLNKTYNIIFKIEPNNYVAYKEVSEDELSHYEKPYSQKNGNKYLVPIGGFGIEDFFNKELQKDTDYRDTNVLIKTKVDSKYFKSANFFSIDKQKFLKFTIENKKDVLPKDYFEGDWYFNQATIEKRVDVEGLVGDMDNFALDHRGRYIDASKIKFIIKKDNLFGVSTNLDPKLLENDNEINYSAAVKIPGELVDYKRESEGQTYGMNEEKDEQLRPENRRYFKMNIEDVETSSDVANQGGGILSMIFSSIRQFNNIMKVIKVEYYKDYFSFVLQNGQSGKIIKYAFMRANKDRNYKSRIAYMDDMKKFGFFTVKQPKIADETTVRRDDVEKLMYIARHNPNKDIVYHFSTTTPKAKWIRDIGREAINLWQQAFKKAGLKNTIILSEDFDVEIGDIRYNILNIISDDISANSAAGGFGPTLQDPATGEIISATANIYIWSTAYYNIIRNFLSTQLGYHVDFYSTATSTNLNSKIKDLAYTMERRLITQDENGEYQPLPVYQWADKNQTKVKFAPLVNVNDFNTSNGQLYAGYGIKFDNFHEFYAQVTSLQKEHGDFIFGIEDSLTLDQSILIHNKEMDQFVNKFCPTVSAFIAKFKNAKSLPTTEEENEVLKPCVQQYLQLNRLGTTIHELGHTLGLRHNFAGSADAKNYLPLNSYEHKHVSVDKYASAPHWGSIMDYADFTVPGTRVAPGAYDIAALRYGYDHVLELAGAENPGQGKMVKLDEKQSIEQFLASNSAEMRDYRYCTDWEGRDGHVDVFCDLQDHGSTATEIVSRYADEMLYSLGKSALRYDTISAPSNVSPTYWLTKMKGFYDKWREFVLQEVGVNRQYLQGISQQEYDQIINKMVNDPVMGETYKDFLKARNIMVNIMLDLAFMPNKYCVTEDESGEERLLEFSTIRQELQITGYRGDVVRCSDEVIAGESGYLASKKLKLKDEIGYFLEGGIYSLDPVDLSGRPLDFSGSLVMRLSALNWMSIRAPISALNADNGFWPNMLDEPDVRQLVQTLILKRAFEGVYLKNRTINIPAYAQARTLSKQDFDERIIDSHVFKKFKEEQSIVTSHYKNYLYGLTVPGDKQASNDRLRAFAAGMTGNPTLVQEVAKKVYRVNNTAFVYAIDENSITAQIMGLLQSIEQSEMTSIEISQLNSEELKGAKVFAAKVLSSLFPPGQPITMGDLIAATVKIQNTIQEATKNNVNKTHVLFLGFAVGEFIQGAQQNLAQLAQMIGQMTGGKGSPEQIMQMIQAIALNPDQAPKDDEVAQNLVQMLSTDVTKEFLEDQKQFASSTELTQHLDKVAEAAINSAQQASSFQKNLVEIQAQKGILKTFLELNTQF